MDKLGRWIENIDMMQALFESAAPYPHLVTDNFFQKNMLLSYIILSRYMMKNG